MKKLLSLLSVLTISGTAVPTTIAASPYQKEETKLENSDINYQQTNNLENLNRFKRDTGSDCESDSSWSLGRQNSYCTLSPELWEEITIIMNKNLWRNCHFTHNYQFLSNLIREKMEEFNVKRFGHSNLISTIIFSFDVLNNEWQKSDKKHHIRIVSNLNYCNANYSACLPRTHFESVNIRNDWGVQNNKYLSRLENDLKIFNLNVIKDCNDKTILNAIKEKNPNLDISKIEIFKKYDYSHFSGFFSVTIKVKNGDDYYSQGPIKNNIIFNTEIKLKELSDKLENDPLVKQWLNYINDYNKNLPTKIENLKTYIGKQKRDRKIIEKEIIKGYILHFEQIIRLIENEWKINELNNTVQNLKSDINNLKSDINNLHNLISNLNNEKECRNLISKMSNVAKLLPFLGNIISGVISLHSSVCQINNA